MENTEEQEDFTVNDGVFTREDSINIIRLLNKFKKSFIKEPSSYYTRKNIELTNPFEYMIEEYLKRIKDNSLIVEYWFRGIWIDIDCHQDLNEYLLETGEIINPLHCHIMYLSQDTIESGTILFNSKLNKVTTIYPKIGRLVRFKGDSFHYVPNPYEYIFGKNSTSTYNKPRFVLLFNTWNEYISNPIKTILKCKTLLKPKFQPISQWKKLNIFETVKLKNEDFTFRVKYKGDSQTRFNLKKIENFFVDRRFEEDGHSLQIIMYECRKENVTLETQTEEHDNSILF